MNSGGLELKIEAARQRLKELEERAKGPKGSEQQAVALGALEELSVALEELHVGAEELRHQNEELAATRQAVEAERQRYQDLFELAPDGYLVTDPQGIIREANRAAATLLGVRPDLLTAKPLAVFVSKEDLTAFYDRQKRFEGGPEITRGWQFSLQPRNREPVPVSVTVAAVRDGGGRLSGLRWLLHDITDRKRAEEELRVSREQLRALAARLETKQEEERAGTAQAVHDEVGQGLAGLKLNLASLIARLPKDQPAWRERAGEMLALINTMIDAVRRISEELHSSLLEYLGLAAAIRSQAQEFQDRTGIKCAVVGQATNLPLKLQQATTLFRILQESLNNIARHAQATQVTIRLQEEADNFLLVVEDNGRGITEQEIASGASLGLIRTRERVFRLGGDLAIVGRPNAGSTVSVRVPLRSF